MIGKGLSEDDLEYVVQCLDRTMHEDLSESLNG